LQERANYRKANPSQPMTTVVGRSANVVGRAAGIWSYDKLPPVQLGMDAVEPSAAAAAKCKLKINRTSLKLNRYPVRLLRGVFYNNCMHWYVYCFSNYMRKTNQVRRLTDLCSDI